jgi:hypothetical protein
MMQILIIKICGPAIARSLRPAVLEASLSDYGMNAVLKQSVFDSRKFEMYFVPFNTSRLSSYYYYPSLIVRCLIYFIRSRETRAPRRQIKRGRVMHPR